MRGRGAAAPAEPRREREVSAAPPATGPARGGGGVCLRAVAELPFGCRGERGGGCYGPAFHGRSAEGGGAGGGAAALPVCVWPGTVL